MTLAAPDPALTDGVVTLRPFRPADAEQVTAACQDPGIQRYIPVPVPYTGDDGHAYVERTIREWADGSKAAFTIVEPTDDDHLLGAVNVSIVGSAGNAGYWVAPHARGRGVAARALRLVTDWSFAALELGVVILEIREENEASIGVAEAVGFHRAGRLDVNTATGKKGGLIFSRLATDRPSIKAMDPIRTLAGSDVAIPALGLGTWAWGDKATWGMGGYDADLTRTSIREAYEASIDAGVTLLDTAEVYGKGESERIIGELLAADPDRASRTVVASKFMPFPWRLGVHGLLRRAARDSVDRLGVEAIDLYQLHGPISLRGHGALAEALAAAHQEGLIRAVGVSNYSVREMRSMAGALERNGLRLASNQIEYSLLRRMPETGGLIAACHELGVVPLAYSPIGQGRLTGKYSAANPPPGKRTFANHPMEQVDGVVDVLRRIGSAHDGRTPSQVALRWLIEKGAVPIPGAKSASQAEQNAGALGWALEPAEVLALDKVALQGRRTIGNRFWQHG